MRYEAKIENNIVIDTIICDDNYTHNLPGLWIEYNPEVTVSVGYTYNEHEGFSPPRPFNSWIWNETEKNWDSPIPVPDDQNIYEWDELNQTWVMIYMKV